MELPIKEVPILDFPWSPGMNPDFLRSREWLVTNGLGGYASGTLLGESTRKYHGLFIPNLAAPYGRTVFIPRFEDSVFTTQEQILLSGGTYEGGTSDGIGYEYLEQFRLEWQIPIWIFNVSGSRIQKRIIMPNGKNTVYVEYQLLDGPEVTLHLRPYLTLRGHDAPLGHPHDWPFTLTVLKGRFEIQAFPGSPTVRLGVSGDESHFLVESKNTEKNVFYRIEDERGLESTESLHSPGYFSISLKSGMPMVFVASVDPWDVLYWDAEAIIETEQKRLQQVLTRAFPSLQEGWMAHLVLAADQFIIKPEPRLTEHQVEGSENSACSVIAGYHWFTDWGRDTMISLEGLVLCTGRYDEARTILHTFGRYIHHGLLPNHFPEGNAQAIYNTIDATLWFFHAIHRYIEVTGDRETLKILFPTLQEIIHYHLTGTDFNIRVDPDDGLLQGGAAGYALTWMDAKVDEWVVTPRRGKPVEIQALWYNALRLMEQWSTEFSIPSTDYASWAEKVYRSFNEKFWNPSQGFLYDLLDEKDQPDETLRPNPLFSISLTHPVLRSDRWESVVRVVNDRLLTLVGVRTLDPTHPDYHPRYIGNRRERDAAYHQGMVWAWLIGPFLDAWMKVYNDRARARTLLHGFEAHLRDAGIGTISEIFDGEFNHLPRGCIAQAWSVAELLRLWVATEGPAPSTV